MRTVSILPFLLASIIALLTGSQSAQAQLQADFTANVEEGCQPLSVDFQDQSSGNVNNYTWTFGNGNSSTKPDPEATYVNSGTYDVTLIVKNGNQADTITKKNFISVYEPPESGFKANPKQGCLPLNVSFQEEATTGNAPISKYIWGFGDGGSSNKANPNHRYRQQGSFSVSLIVKDSNGCEGVETKQNLIGTSQVPNADFNAQNVNACEAPAVVQFRSRSSGQRPLSYQWNFGDGNTDTTANPSHAYQQNGNYDVQLIVTNARGCSDTITKQSLVTIQPFTGDFSIDQREGCTKPLTTFQFTDQSNPSPTFQQWQFGDGSTSSDANPDKRYSSKGVYPITYISGFGSCRDTTRDTVRVQQINATITADTFNSCDTALKVNFSSQTSNVANLEWDFGDGTTSNQENPSHTYTKFGEYNVQFDATNPIGCELNKDKITVKIQKPKAGFNYTPSTNKGCKSEEWEFSDTSIVPGFERLTERNWQFPRGNSSTAPQPSFKFSDTGDFQVSLAIETSGGCRDSAQQKFFLGDTPTYSITVDTTVYCASDKVKFNSSTDFADSSWFNYDNESTYRFSDQNSYKPLEEDPEFEYSDTGFFRPRGEAFFNGCPSGKVKLPDSFYINPPVADFESFTQCDTPFKRVFNDNSIQPDTWRWSFGDGDTSRKQNPVHFYNKEDFFNVELITKNDSTGCKDTIVKPVFIEKIKASFSISDTVGCPPLKNVQFDASGSENVSGDNYFWNFGNGNILNKTNAPDNVNLVKPPPQTYARSDSIPITLAVRDRNLCRDTATRYVEVYTHNTSIQTERLKTCVPAKIGFDSEINVDTALTLKEWTFGDGSAPVQTDTPTHTYDQTGSYQATLRTADENGCTKTATKTIGVTKPQVFFQSFERNLCRKEQTSLEAQRSAQPLEYKWFFGNGDSARGNTVEKGYSKNGKYDITLIGTDTNQCNDTLVRDDYLTVRSPKASFTLDDTSAFCPPFVTRFNDSTDGKNLDYEWAFGDGSFSVLEEPQHTYTIVDTFKATLTVTNDFGCANADSQQIVLDGPIANFKAIPDSGCKPLDYEFRAFDKRGVEEIRWDFGDGNTASGDTVEHAYTSGGAYLPVVLIDNGREDNRKCEYGIELSDTVRVDTNQSSIKSDKPSYCIYEEVALTNDSEGAIEAYEWKSLGSDKIDSGQLPDFDFDTAKTYNLRLITTNYKGCKDSNELQFSVYPKPEVIAGDSTFICRGEQAQLNATFDSRFDYQWNPSDGLSAPQQYNPLAGPDRTTTYRVRITDENGCKDTSNAIQVEVQQEPNPVAVPDTTIVKGDSAVLRSSTETPVRRLEWSPSDSLRCTKCASPIARPFQDQTYTLTVEDTAGCFVQKDKATITVDRRFKIAIPEAFTPNQDAINDIIEVRGWGVSELIYFKVYNRWGELVFKTQDIEEGWDGRYNGEPLPTGTYAYQIKARSYSGTVGVDEGHFNLIR